MTLGRISQRILWVLYMGIANAWMAWWMQRQESRDDDDETTHHPNQNDPSIWIQTLQEQEVITRLLRALSEIALVLAGTAVSLQLWKQIVPESLIQQLLFFHVAEAQRRNDGGSYEEIQQQEKHDVETYDDNDADDVAPENDAKVKDNSFSSSQPSLLRIPTPQTVLCAALDLFSGTLIGLFFVMLGRGDTPTSVAARWAQRVPFLVLAGVSYRLIRTKPNFWHVLGCTLRAPLAPVTFRDGFVGDVLTSTVRPLQDLVHVLVYLIASGSQRMLSFTTQSSTEDRAESSSSSSSSVSWWLYTVWLPLCMIGPLWWRFLQNLKQIYLERQRWPYAGNALKYFAAAQVAITGVYFPEWQHRTVWLLAFGAATLYQIYWDVFMDWGLLEPTCHRNGPWSWQLRSKRLYSSSCWYWTIAGINVILRFGWTLTFIPADYLNPSGVLLQQNTLLVMSPLLASAEVLRRTMWGWLRFEYEALKYVETTNYSSFSALAVPSSSNDNGDNDSHDDRYGLELITNRASSPTTDEMQLPELPPQKSSHWNEMSHMTEVQVVLELSLYAAAFALSWLICAAHRSTL